MSTIAIPHPTALRPWQPLTDAEFASLKPYLPSEDGRGKPTDRRRLMDAIFWIAASPNPWHTLPPELGKPNSVSRTLRRWARAGILDRLLIMVSNHPLSTVDETLRGLTWLICRAFRRMTRVLDEASVKVADRLGMTEALPANPVRFFDPNMSKIAEDFHGAISKSVVIADIGLMKSAHRALRAAWRLTRLALGNRRAWRLK